MMRRQFHYCYVKAHIRLRRFIQRDEYLKIFENFHINEKKKLPISEQF